MQASADAQGFRLIGHSDLNGHGDAMQVVKKGDFVFVAHVGASPLALTILDVSDPTCPRVVRQLERPANTHCHKVQIAGNVLIQNAERSYVGKVTDDPPPVTGLYVYTLDDPTDPRPVAFYPVPGTGVHRIWFEEPPYAHIAACLPGVRNRAYQIVDLSRPGEPKLVGGWWVPGGKDDDPDPWYGAGEAFAPTRFGGRMEVMGVHGAIPHGNRSYVSCLDAGFALLDISDLSRPSVLGRVNWHPPYGGFLHTSLPLPGRGLVICGCEALKSALFEEDGDKRVWVVDVRNERQPVVISTFPWPTPPARAPWARYWDRPGNSGPHNLHENRSGSFRSEHVIFVTWNNAGLRLYDVGDPFRPVEIGHFVPEPPAGQDAPATNDLYVDADGLVYLTDRHHGGLYVLECTEKLA
jgi:hypothetical protein